MFRWFVAVGVLVLCSGAGAQASDFAPQTNYVIRVGGFDLPAEATAGKEILTRTPDELAKFKPSKELRANPVFVQVYLEASKLLETKGGFAIEFSTDARGNVTTAAIVTREGRKPITPGAAAIAATAPATPTPPPATPPTPTPAPTAPVAATPEEPTPGGIRRNGNVKHLLIVGREASAEEKRNWKATAIDYDTFLKAKVGDPTKQAYLDFLKTQAKDSAGETFTFSWEEDARGNLVSDVDFVRPGGKLALDVRKAVPVVAATTPAPAPASAPAPTPSVEPEVATAPTLESLEATLAMGSFGEKLLDDVALWLVTAPEDLLQCALGEGGHFNFSVARVETLLSAVAVRNATDLQTMEMPERFAHGIGSVPASGRLAVFAKRKSANPCLKPLFENAWTKTLAVATPSLAGDFGRVLRDVWDHRSELTVDTETHSFKVREAETALKLDYLKELLLRLEAKSLQALPATLREWATFDTNSTDSETRKEPIDILTTHLTTTAHADLATDLSFGDVGRIGVVKGAIQHRLLPTKYAPQVLVSRTSEARTKDLGKKLFYVFCTSDTSTLSSSKDQPNYTSPLFRSAAFTEGDLTQLRNQRGAIDFVCGGQSLRLRIPEQSSSTAIRNPVDHRYSIGDDHRIKAVTTFPVVGAAGIDVVFSLKAGTVTQGYKYISESTPGDFKQAFLDDMADSDFYIAAAHHLNAAKFDIGTEGSTRLVMERKDGENVNQLIIYVPGRRPGKPVSITDSEVAALFKQRRERSEQRRLTVMNVACNSESCIPPWMAAYRASLGSTSFTPAQVERLQGEVPIIIGANRTFATSDASTLLSHAVHPFTALRAAGSESTLTELLAALDSRGFKPRSNTANLQGFDIQTQTQDIVIVIEGKGVRVVY